jgi:hypothetical protein
MLRRVKAHAFHNGTVVIVPIAARAVITNANKKNVVSNLPVGPVAHRSVSVPVVGVGA